VIFVDLNVVEIYYLLLVVYFYDVGMVVIDEEKYVVLGFLSW